jgi:hypothetical protein
MQSNDSKALEIILCLNNGGYKEPSLPACSKEVKD